MSISPIQPTAVAASPETQPHKPESVGEAFLDALDTARKTDAESTEMAEKFAKGDTSVGIHEVMISSEKADIAFRYATTLKNKALEAYRELMNTQV